MTTLFDRATRDFILEPPEKIGAKLIWVNICCNFFVLIMPCQVSDRGWDIKNYQVKIIVWKSQNLSVFICASLLT